MALYVCPECGHKKVSEHASFCPMCGCTIEYIRNFYIEKAKKDSFLQTLPPSINNLIDTIKENLNKNRIPYTFSDFIDIVGFKHKEKDLNKYFFYVVRNKSEDKLMVTIKNHHSDRKKIFEYDLNKHSYYVQFMFRMVFDIELEDKEKTEETKKPLSSISPYLAYKYTVYQNNVEEIEIIKNDLKDGKEVIYYKVINRGVERYCLVSNIRKVLFKTESEAEKNIGPHDPSEKITYYVLFDQKSNQYFSGYRESSQPSSVFLGNYFTENRGSRVVYKVPTFTSSIKDAVRFTFYESALREQQILSNEDVKLEIGAFELNT